MDAVSAPATATDGRSDWALLALRLALGSLFFAQGATKWGWFGGTDPPGMSGLEQFLQILGYDSRTALAWLLTATEVGAGLLLITGLLTPLAAAGAIGIAFNGAFVLSWQGGFANGWGGWIVFMAGAGAVALLGPGRYSLDGVAPWRSVGWVSRWLVGTRAGVSGIALGVVVGALVVTTVGPGFDSTPSFAPPPASENGEGIAVWCQDVAGIRQALAAGGTIPDETFAQFVDSAPGDIRQATETASEALRASPEDAFADPEVETAIQEIEAYAASNC